MAKKHWIYLKRGLSEDSKHRERMGNRVWLFLHIIDRAEWETGVVHDWRDKQEADDMCMSWRTLQRQRQELEELGYITSQQDLGHQEIIIHNWINPRNYSGEVINQAGGDYAKMRTGGTQQGTQQGTQHPYRGLRTPSISNSKSIDQESDRRAPRAPDPRSQHPAIVAIREIITRYPSKDVYDLLIRTLGEAPDVPRLRECWEAWRGHGFKPTNMAWATEWYITGIPQNGNGHSPVTGLAAVLQVAREEGIDLHG